LQLARSTGFEVASTPGQGQLELRLPL